MMSFKQKCEVDDIEITTYIECRGMESEGDKLVIIKQRLLKVHRCINRSNTIIQKYICPNM